MQLRINQLSSISISVISIVCLAVTSDGLLAAPSDGLTWEYETVSTTSSNLLKPNSKLVLDSMDEPHIIFQRNRVPFSSAGDIYHAFRSSGLWQIDTVASCTLCGVQPDAAFDSMGNLHIAYQDAGTLQYGVRTGSSWQLQQIRTPGILVGHVHLAVDSSGIPKIVFNNNDIISSGHFATMNDSTWSIETIKSGFSPYSIALDNLGEPVVAGFEAQFLKVAHRQSTAWSIETIGPGGFQASLAIDASGTPHIGHAVINDDDLRYATRSAGNWSNDIVFDLGPGAAGPSLALGPNGRPRMTFEIHLGDPGGPDDQVMHAVFTGNQWITGIVDPRLSSESHTSLSIGDDGASHVVYSLRNGDLIYAHALAVPEPYGPMIELIALVVLGCCRRHLYAPIRDGKLNTPSLP